jgi:hypothetical protein
VYDLPMTFTILSGRWVGNTGCTAKSSTKGGHPTSKVSTTVELGYSDTLAIASNIEWNLLNLHKTHASLPLLQRHSWNNQFVYNDIWHLWTATNFGTFSYPLCQRPFFKQYRVTLNTLISQYPEKMYVKVQ